MGAILGLLLIVGTIIRYWWWLVAAAALVGALWYGRVLYVAWEIHAAARARYHAAICARADQQHAWVMAGDDRGTWGRYPPATL
jgi:hypothetical protein